MKTKRVNITHTHSVYHARQEGWRDAMLGEYRPYLIEKAYRNEYENGYRRGLNAVANAE